MCRNRVRIWQAFLDIYRTKFVARYDMLNIAETIWNFLQTNLEMYVLSGGSMLSTVFRHVIERHKRSRYRRSGLNQLHVFEASWPTKHALVIPGKSELCLIESTVHSVEWSELRHNRTMQGPCPTKCLDHLLILQLLPLCFFLYFSRLSLCFVIVLHIYCYLVEMGKN